MNDQFVLSTVGISLFLRLVKDSERSKLNRISNEKNLPDEDQEWINRLSEEALNALKQGNVDNRRYLSAEINGLYALYEGDLLGAQNDLHWLISTDTYLGRQAANVVERFLKEQGIAQVEVYPPPGLSTASAEFFSQGMQHLLRWCEDTIPRYKEKGYRIIFNLTGSFKSLQGHLNIVGMFYADEIAYIFEGSTSLLRIPRLPIQVDPKPIQAYAAQIAMMSVGQVLPYEQVSALPEGLLEIDSAGNAIISDWGHLIWNRLKNDLLEQTLLPFPRLVYLPSFRRDFEQARPQDKVRLQETLARVAYMLEEASGDTTVLKQHGGLRYDNYVNKRDEERHPIGHFRVSRRLRVSCVSKGGKLYLRHFGGKNRL